MATKQPTPADRRIDPKAYAKEVARLNRQRGKAMERQVAKLYTGSTRVLTPQSGAGWRKGDCNIPFSAVNPLLSNDAFLVECKSSAKRTRTDLAFIRVQHAWLEKMHYESRVMGCLFPILAIHFHRISGYYIFFREDAVPLHTRITGIDFVFNASVQNTERVKQNGNLIQYTSVYENTLREIFAHGYTAFSFAGDRYIAMRLEDHRAMLQRDTP